MQEQSYRKAVFFRYLEEDIFRLRMIGYNDFRYLKSNKQSRVPSCDALHFVVSGRGKMLLGDREYDIEQGDLFLLPHDEPVIYFASDEEPWDYYWISFSPSSKIEMQQRLGMSMVNPVKKSRNPQKIKELFEQLFAENDQSERLDYRALSAFLLLLSLEGDGMETRKGQSNRRIALVEDAKQIMQIHYANEEFSAGKLPGMLYVSGRHLGKMFKEETGLTLAAYLVAVRLNHAGELLRSREYSISELCSATGFGDERYFMKRFKEKFGVTVKEYRQKCRTNPDGKSR